MVSGSALLRISALLVAAGGLTALVQTLWPHGASDPQPSAPVLRAQTPSIPPPRRVDAAPSPASPTQPPAPDRPIEPPRPLPPLPPPVPVPPPPPPVVETPPAPQPEPPPERPPPRTAPEPQPQTEAPRAVGLVDLNTASLAELNGLRGGGSIGRAIIQKRPYASVDQLLSKRVLTRGVYERIKDQVSVQ